MERIAAEASSDTPQTTFEHWPMPCSAFEPSLMLIPSLFCSVGCYLGCRWKIHRSTVIPEMLALADVPGFRAVSNTEVPISGRFWFRRVLSRLSRFVWLPGVPIYPPTPMFSVPIVYGFPGWLRTLADAFRTVSNAVIHVDPSLEIAGNGGFKSGLPVKSNWIWHRVLLKPRGTAPLLESPLPTTTTTTGHCTGLVTLRLLTNRYCLKPKQTGPISCR